MHYRELIDGYLSGIDQVQAAVQGMTSEQCDARPIPGRWSTRQVICHLADFEPIYADRMKRVIAEQCPTFFGGDPDVFAAGLAYERRSIDDELAMIAVVRKNMALILRDLKSSDFQREGRHSEAGLLSLETLLQRITDHIPHHLQFIAEKRQVLGLAPRPEHFERSG